ncbi:hypothetical protein ACVWWN_002385 [Mycobacterium sp. URHB0021]
MATIGGWPNPRIASFWPAGRRLSNRRRVWPRPSGLGPDDLWLKRDDLTGLAGGADTLVTTGARKATTRV